MADSRRWLRIDQRQVGSRRRAGFASIPRAVSLLETYSPGL
ncbi:MAG: hypothetical protein ACJAUC_003543 [Planctomycetota bacterium]